MQLLTAFCALPLTVRLAIWALVGWIVGGQLNRGIYALAWVPRPLNPWLAASEPARRRNWLDRIPVWGWWRLRREADLHGRGFWIRPLIIECAATVALPVLYWFEVECQGLWPHGTLSSPPPAATLHVQFLCHALLVALMTVATFIDFDEQTIPDEITVTGTILALAVTLCFPAVLLPTRCEPEPGFAYAHHLVVTSSTNSLLWRDGWGGPFSWPGWLDGLWGLALALAGIWIWCLAIMHKTWTLRRGWIKAVQFLVASVARGRSWRLPAVLGLVASAMMFAGWWIGGYRWEAVLSATAGLSFGGGLIWCVRIVGGHALGTEAMGFGDVTLMAMIGAFLGWQPSFLVFFMAPFSALVIALVQWVLTGDRHIAFGPYLCLSAVLLLIFWDRIWIHWLANMFALGWFIPAILVCCLVMMGGMLWLWRLFRDAIFGY